jgi:cyclopropane fatty-acyl-phospholipid synthase-like methyltransferase
MVAVPERVRWAVETRAVEPGDRVLEIGCGSGVAAALVCGRLDDGWMLAIDRSQVQIERARQRNEAQLASGRLSLETVELAELDVGSSSFDKVFAININVFWLGPAEAELAAVRRALTPAGTLFLFYETPGPGRASDTAERLRGVLWAQDFTEPEMLTPAQTLLGCITRPRASVP